MTPAPRRIICLALSGIGNFLMQSPVFAAIRKKYPDSHLTVWVAPRGTRALAENDPHIDEVIESPLKLPLWLHLRLIMQLAQQRFDTGIVLSPGQHWKSAAYLFLAGVPTRIGALYRWRGNPNSSFLLTHSINEIDTLHDIEQNLRLLEPLAITSKQTPILNYHLDLPAANVARATEMIQCIDTSIQKKFVGFHAGSAAGFEWKRWPVENFVAVGKALIEKNNAHILLFGGNEEKEINRQLKDALGNAATIIDEDLLTVAALMQQCRLMLSNDSGLMHVSAAVGTTTYGLFGPTNEQHTGPRGVKSRVIRAAGTVPIYDTDKNYSLPGTSHTTILAITPELVLEQIKVSL